MGGTGANSPKAEPYVCRRLKLIGRKPIRAGLGPDDPPERLTELADDLELLSELDVLSQEGLFQLRATIQEVKQRWPEHDKPGGARFPAGSRRWKRRSVRRFDFQWGIRCRFRRTHSPSAVAFRVSQSPPLDESVQLSLTASMATLVDVLET